LSGVSIARSQKAGFTLHYYLRNMMYSLLTTLEWKSLVRVMPLYFGIFFASMIGAALFGRWPVARSHWKALSYNLGNLSRIREQRRRIRAIRKRSDKEIFAIVLRNPRVDYFIKTFQGRLAQYVD
jgi:hypothetical protein